MRPPSALLATLVFIACGPTGTAPAQIAAEPPSTAAPVEEEPAPEEPEPTPTPGQNRWPRITETCDTKMDVIYIAEHAFPGRSVESLGRVFALVPTSVAASSTVGSRFPFTRPSTLFIREGMVAVQCAQGTTVTFVDP
jgi:hypothetical protein